MLELFEEAELVEVTNLRAPGAFSIDASRLQSAIDGAIGICDGWLALKYALPITNPTLLTALRIHSANIARYLLDSSTEPEQKKYDSAIGWLRAITSNSASAIGTDGVTDPGAEEAIAAVLYEVPPARYGALAEGLLW